MNIEFTTDKNVEIEMKDYLKKSIDAYGKDIKGVASTPAKHDLFNTIMK